MPILKVPIWNAEEKCHKPYEVKASLVAIEGFEKFTFATHRPFDRERRSKPDRWVVVEASTGGSVIERAGPRYVVLAAAKERLEHYGLRKLRQALARHEVLNPELKPKR